MSAAGTAPIAKQDVDIEKPELEAAPIQDRAAIERLAYTYWEERGCPDGSGEEDWLRAEEILRAL